MNDLSKLLDSIAKYIPGRSRVRAEDINKIVEALRIALNISGPYVTVTRHGIHIRRQPMTVDPIFFWAKVTNNQLITPNRWAYAGTEQVWDRLTTKFKDKTGGRLITFSAPVWNPLETFNAAKNGIAGDAAGIIAPGIDIDGPAYPAGFAPKPISNLSVVPVVFDESDANNPLYWMLSLPNAHDGSCT